MNAAQLLNSKGVSMQQASDWVQARLESPGEIYSICLEFGINSTMLAEIVQPFVPGVVAGDVEFFFSSAGFDALGLRNAGALPPVPMPTPVQPPGTPIFSAVLPVEFSGLLSFLSLNESVGALSNASLREASFAQGSTPASYLKLFDPASIGGQDDFIWTTAELGFAGLGNLPATTETLESLFYGTIIRLVRSIDEQEVMQIEAFADANEAALEAGNIAVLNSLVQQLTNAFSTPAAVPMISDQELAAVLPYFASAAAEVVGTGGGNLFGGFLDIVL